jgi:hypothetical protein
VGVLALLNDAGTTVTLLDVDAELDVRAARNLVAHRDGPDAQPATSDDDRFETVAEVGLDVRAAAGLVEQRPFPTLEEVALVPYVGPAALQDLVDYGLAHPAAWLDTAAATAALAQASDGLWFTSESDYPLEVWSIPGAAGPLTVEQALVVLEAAYVPRPGRPGLSERTGEPSTLGWMFDRYTVQQDWWEDAQIEAMPRWQALRDLFESELGQPQVFRFGIPDSQGTLSGDIDIFVLGQTSDGALVGLKTVSIET